MKMPMVWWCKTHSFSPHLDRFETFWNLQGKYRLEGKYHNPSQISFSYETHFSKESLFNQSVEFLDSGWFINTYWHLIQYHALHFQSKGQANQVHSPKVTLRQRKSLQRSCKYVQALWFWILMCNLHTQRRAYIQ